MPVGEGFGLFFRSLARSSLRFSNGRLIVLLFVLGTLAFGLALEIFLAWRIENAVSQYPNPQAILVLDGSNSRILKAARFARSYPTLPVWISGNCSERSLVKAAFSPLEQDGSRPEESKLEQSVYYDLRATDTVTHFTTLVDDFVEKDIRHVFLVTSSYHISRAQVSARVVFGSRGVVTTPVALPTAQGTEESRLKSVRDRLRSVLWLFTGRTGAGLNPQLNHLPGDASCLSELRERSPK